MQIDKKFIEFFLWIVGAILASYYAPEIVMTPFYIIMLIRYFYSKNEALWFALFFVFADGFLGFFNNYEVVIKLIPGLPPIEVSHFYVAVALVKAAKNGPLERPLFIKPILTVLLIYLGFLIVQGYVLGLDPAMNVQFRLIKFIFPLTLFYSIPRLFRTEQEYHEIFKYLFPLAFAALFAQVFTISTGQTPSQFLGVQRDFWFTVDVSKGKTYRGFYSTSTVLMSYFGAMYLLAHGKTQFNKVYLFGVLAADLLVAILSATRGWLLGLGFSLFLFVVFVMRLPAKQLARMMGATIILIIGLFSIPVVNQQISNAMLRFSTLNKLASGDATAGGTLERLDKRSPRVMNRWREAPLTGWGFSDGFFKYHDFHVGNQNILLHSGIIGAFLMALFFIFFHLKLILRSQGLPHGHPLKQSLLSFAAFFPGWFMIHSSSGQQFSYYQGPSNGMMAAVFFTLGGYAFLKSFDGKFKKKPGYAFGRQKPENETTQTVHTPASEKS